jgi:sporulation protein YlmC with PRC-barrel domain
MIRIFLPLLCAALGLATASCSQTQGPLTPAAGATAPPAAAAMVNPFDAPAPRAAQLTASAPAASPAQPQATVSPIALAAPPVERRASTLIGMPVVSADGNPLGRVNDIIFDRQGRATHLVISYHTEPSEALPPGAAGGTAPPAASASGRTLTAIPWDAAMASVKDGQLVLAGAILHAAPSFTPDAWPNLADPDWSTASDAYWRKAVRAAIEAHPGTPIDPTSRSRSRSRDGG